jgi:uncharacterized glyoxalase superfamily protein PhnB
VPAYSWEEAAVYPGDEPGTVAHAELHCPGGGGIMLGSHGDDGQGPPPGRGSVYIVTQGIDALHDRARRAGAEIVRPLRDEEYGSRAFTARDPEGVIWSFGTCGGVAAEG